MSKHVKHSLLTKIRASFALAENKISPVEISHLYNVNHSDLYRGLEALRTKGLQGIAIDVGKGRLKDMNIKEKYANMNIEAERENLIKEFNLNPEQGKIRPGDSEQVKELKRTIERLEMERVIAKKYRQILETKSISKKAKSKKSKLK